MRVAHEGKLQREQAGANQAEERLKDTVRRVGEQLEAVQRAHFALQEDHVGAERRCVQLDKELQRAKETMASRDAKAKEALRSAHTAAAQLKEAHVEEQTRQLAEIAGIKLESRSLFETSQAAITRLQSLLEATSQEKDAEITRLKQVALQTKHNSSVEVRRIIDEYQARTASTNEMLSGLKVKMEAESAAKARELKATKDDAEKEQQSLREELLRQEQTYSDALVQVRRESDARLAECRESLQGTAAADAGEARKEYEQRVAQLESMHRIMNERQVLLQARAKEDREVLTTSNAAEVARVCDEYEHTLRRFREQLSNKNIEAEELRGKLSSIGADASLKAREASVGHKQELADVRNEYETRLANTTTEFHENTSKLMTQHSAAMASTLKKMDEKVREIEDHHQADRGAALIKLQNSEGRVSELERQRQDATQAHASAIGEIRAQGAASTKAQAAKHTKEVAVVQLEISGIKAEFAASTRALEDELGTLRARVKESDVKIQQLQIEGTHKVSLSG